MEFDIKEFKDSIGGDLFKRCLFKVTIGDDKRLPFMINKIILSSHVWWRASAFENEEMEVSKALDKIISDIEAEIPTPTFLTIELFAKDGKLLKTIKHEIRTLQYNLSLDWSAMNEIANYDITIITKSEK